MPNGATCCKLLGLAAAGAAGRHRAEVQGAGGAEAGSRVDHAFRNELARRRRRTRGTRWCSEYIRRSWPASWASSRRALETDRPLSTFGLDSLLALELKNNLESRLDFTLPMAKLMEGPSIASLAEETVRLIFGEACGERRVGRDRESPAAEAARRMSLDAARARCEPTARGRRWFCCRRWAAMSRYYAELVAATWATISRSTRSVRAASIRICRRTRRWRK